jgi:hypothetical protein
VLEPSFVFGQSIVSTTSCGWILLDPQGRLHYTPSAKKRVLITSSHICIEGSVVGVQDSLNEAYYGKPVTPMQILVDQTVSNEGSTKLRAFLKHDAQ